jgi:glycosyltransferase involved in cell wall biosynthesis
LNIPNDRQLFLYVGRLSPDKCVDLLFLAFDRLRSQDPKGFQKSHLLIVGGGKQENSLRRLADGCNLNVTFCGVHRDDLELYYSAAWCFLLPTKIESFGLVLLESGLCSTPAIAFRPQGRLVQTAADEIIIHNQTGYLAHPPNAQGLMQAIHEAINWSAEERIEKGRAAQRFISSHFRWDLFVKRVIDICS